MAIFLHPAGGGFFAAIVVFFAITIRLPGSRCAFDGVKDRIQPATADGTGHTEWANGHSHHSGFTATLPPNTDVSWTDQGVTYDADFASRQEGSNTTAASYSILTSRSDHVGIVNSLLADGSIRSVSENIDWGVWRALGTRNGGEVGGEF